MRLPHRTALPQALRAMTGLGKAVAESGIEPEPLELAWIAEGGRPGARVRGRAAYRLAAEDATPSAGGR